MKRSPNSSAARAGGLIPNTASGVQLPLRRLRTERDPWFTILIAGIVVGFVFLGICSAVGL